MSDFVGWAGLLLAVVALPPVWARLVTLWRAVVRSRTPHAEEGAPLLWMRVEDDGHRIRVTNTTSTPVKYVGIALVGAQDSFDKPLTGPTLPPGGSMIWDIPSGTTPDRYAHLQWLGPPSYTPKSWVERRRPDGWHRDTFRLYQVKEDAPAGLATRQLWRFESKWVAWETDATPWQDAAAEFERDYQKMLSE